MPENAVYAFITAACVPLDSGHTTGTLDEAETIRAAHPHVATASALTAAILGDADTVSRFLNDKPENATKKNGPHGWDPLTGLCFSRYLRLDYTRSERFVKTARILLDAGADPNTGFYSHEPPEFESALYGAAGVAHHQELTSLLLERGANPNDGETIYHTPEGWDNRALAALLKSPDLTDDSLATMLLRKADWHDLHGVRMLLERGASPNRLTPWGRAAIHQSLFRDNDLSIIQTMLDHGADPSLVAGDLSAIQIAARRGRADALDLFLNRGIALNLSDMDYLVAGCALNDAEAINTAHDPALIEELHRQAGPILAGFASMGNTIGLHNLISLGLDINTPFIEGDGYFDIAPNSSALHVAAWRGRHDTVKYLIEAGANVNTRDCKIRTPLTLAVRACVDSYWTARRAPDSVAALLNAGAAAGDITLPTGYPEVDRLLQNHRPAS